VLSEVTITELEILPVFVPFRTSFKIAAGGARPGVDAIIVLLHTDAGVTGIGETQAWRRQGSRDTVTSLTDILENHFKPHIIGRSPFNAVSVMHALDGEIWHSQYAQAAIGDALLDLQGKLLNVPVYKLLGGKHRDKIHVCAVLGIKPDVAEMIDDAKRQYERGYRSFTIKIGNDPAKDAVVIEEMAKNLGDDCILRFDANAGMDFDMALQLFKRVEGLPIDCAEQPLPPWDLNGMAELARRFSIPMMADESVATPHDLINVIRAGAGSVVQTKIAKNGGIRNCLKLWTIAEAAGMRIYPGNHPCTSVATAAVAHMCAAWAGPLLAGPFATGLDLISDDIASNPLTVEDGSVTIPDGPGLGVTLDMDKIEHMRIAR